VEKPSTEQNMELGVGRSRTVDHMPDRGGSLKRLHDTNIKTTAYMTKYGKLTLFVRWKLKHPCSRHQRNTEVRPSSRPREEGKRQNGVWIVGVRSYAGVESEG
jgi:hypothetical protein